MVKGCLLSIGSIVGGLGIGLAVTAFLRAVTGDHGLSCAIGIGILLLSVPTIHAYASLWFTDPEEIANPPKPRTTIQGWRAAKAENKLQSAEIRMGFVFAMIGGAAASIAKGSNLVITIVTICCAIAGGLIGFDLKRRVRRIRERFAAQSPNRRE
jgi:hypothetical protein